MDKKIQSRTDELSMPQQNYVEAIAELIDEHGHAHPSRIAELMSVRKPSVTEAVDRLVEMGIVKRSSQKVLFTRKGVKIADELANRHETLRSFMTDVLGMGIDDADKAACRIEHSASPKFIKRLKAFNEFMSSDKAARFTSNWRDGTGQA